MKEIGSEFWDVPISEKGNNLFSIDTSWFISGRNALVSIISDIKSKYTFHTVALPSWCCDSIILPFIKLGIEVKFYPVYFDDGLIQDFSHIDTDVILIMDYFGYTGQSNLKGYNGIVIRDVTHSIFSATYNDANYYFGSLRKWAGFWTGGFAWGVGSQGKNDEKYTLLRRNAMKDKESYIQGISSDKKFLGLFDEAEEHLENLDVATANVRDIDLARRMDIKNIKIQRQNNANVLLSAFKEFAIFPTFKETDCPLFVPILVPNNKRKELRQFLISNKIYCPVHWPLSEYHKIKKSDLMIYENELSLVCDQRYTEVDMLRIINIIKKYI